MPGLIHGLDPAKIAANLERAREAGATGRDPRRDQVRAARGDGRAGRGRRPPGRREPPAGDEAKHERWGDAFEWDFIGNLQSRKVRQLLPICRLIHSVATESALEQLGRHGVARHRGAGRGQRRRRGGQGRRRPRELGAFIDRCPVRVVGLMTMPPFSQDPEASRPHFARLAELAAGHGLARLSMGTSQDWQVAVEEGATIIRLGTALYV